MVQKSEINLPSGNVTVIMKLVDIKLRETGGIGRRDEPVCFGVPLPAGAVSGVSQIRLNDGSEDLPLDCSATQYWPDGSVRWCLLDTVVAVAARAEKTLELCIGERTNTQSGVRVTVGAPDQPCTVDTGVVQFQVDTSAIGVLQDQSSLKFDSPQLKMSGGQPTMTVQSAHWSATEARAKIVLTQQGVYVGAQGQELCRFESELAFHASSAKVHWQFTLHNPRAAQHPGGLWDLGDPASLIFQGLEFSLGLPTEDGLRLQAEPGLEWSIVAEQLKLYQASSGGEHWDSPNHVDQSGRCNLDFSGYRLQSGDQDSSGSRASPLLYHTAGFGVYIDRFWQNFPKAIESDAGSLRIQLFPPGCPYAHELQPGERKTHRIRFDFAADESTREGLRAPLQIHLPPEYLAETAAVQHFAASNEAIDELIQIGLDERAGFQAKREIIDEYGWRNFGDIFADHESLYLPQGKLFISHYNNQYDPLYGFLRQYLHSGDPRWMTMANELAWHIGDIDIYSTVEDREEYNGGLFWHTDHYVDAFTASHRTYSRHQRPNGQDVTQGGGPGAEHCYTHGLMLHYCLTGCNRSRQAVLQLTQWITRFYEGTGTLVETLFDIKSRVLPRIRNADDPGKILDHRYPFNRGVGNYVNALLDSHALSGDDAYFQQAERVIGLTFSPQDNIADRNLADVETTWFYSIFLQAVARFLEVKKQRGERSTAGYGFVSSAFIKYAQWIADHDRPYLSQPDILEFPNDTWVAQDIRKACILYYASSYAADDEHRSALLKRADYFYQYVCDALMKSDTRHYSRILAILMQNHGVNGYFSPRDRLQAPEADIATRADTGNSPYRSRGQIILIAVRDVIKALFRVSLRKELGWLRHRHRAFARVYSRLYGLNGQNQ